MSGENYLTAAGAQRLYEELEHLKGTERKQLAKRLRAAIQQGDLSENADYIAAKEEQAFLEGRILELDQILKNAVIIDDMQQAHGVVGIGCHVTIQEDSDTPETYHLVGPTEADPGNGRISHESPIGQALIGHRVGDTITANTPSGSIGYTIVKIW
ncbi:MAG: transcription elongation factor GreA [Anaerolineaceae bacterium]|nr:transcription elongation factor GreA [Anaerolineaceae bacterium]